MSRNQAIGSHSIVDGLSPIFVPGDIPLEYFRSERRCPECGHPMSTNGKGIFLCPGCRHEDRQDVSRLYAAGLDYNFTEHGKSQLMVFGKRSI